MWVDLSLSFVGTPYHAKDWMYMWHKKNYHVQIHWRQWGIQSNLEIISTPFGSPREQVSLGKMRNPVFTLSSITDIFQKGLSTKSWVVPEEIWGSYYSGRHMLNMRTFTKASVFHYSLLWVLRCNHENLGTTKYSIALYWAYNTNTNTNTSASVVEKQ